MHNKLRTVIVHVIGLIYTTELTIGNAFLCEHKDISVEILKAINAVTNTSLTSRLEILVSVLDESMSQAALL
jgi:hypothetical protein